MAKIRRVCAFLAFLAFGIGSAMPALAAGLKMYVKNEQVSSIQVKDLEGKDVDLLGTLKKEKNLLVFFNTSCTLCMQELEFLEKMTKEGKGKDVSVTAIGVDIQGPAVLKKFLELKPLSYPVYSNQNFSVPLSFGFAYTPASVLLDKEFKVVEFYAGYTEESRKQVEELFK